MRKLFSLITIVAALGLAVGPAMAHNSGLPAAPLDNRGGLSFHNNVPSAVGNSMAFFERKQSDGTVRRYVVVATVGNGFDIVDITDPHEPTVVGRYLLGGPVTDPQNSVHNSSAGVNWHAWIDVNPRRNIVALSIEEMPQGGTLSPGALRHEGGQGVTLVDITDVTNPVWLSSFEMSQIDGFNGGPHTVRMIGDNCIYTSLGTVIIDYTDARNPSGAFKATFQGHEFYEDPNIPGRTYMGRVGSGAGFSILDTTDCKNPAVITTKSDPGINAAHEVYPSPDSSYVAIADFRDGQTELECPGGALHFYDISGKHKPGASLTNPIKMGTWLAPFAGAGTTVNPGRRVNYASCTTHSWQMQLERQLAVVGLYAGGTWVLDPSRATVAPGPLGAEYDGARGKTTWGNTLAANRDALDYVNATQWWPFDSESPTEDFSKELFVNGWARGMDTFTYAGTLPKKMSRLTVDASAAGGVVTGKLDRYAVLTHTGFANKPLAGKELTITSGTTSVTVTTAADGSFSADLGLAAGSHQVTVEWAGDAVFAANSLTRSVSA